MSGSIIECKEILYECPICGSELAYEPSHDIIDLYMYCKSDKCNFVGIQKDVYLDKDSLYCEE